MLYARLRHGSFMPSIIFAFTEVPPFAEIRSVISRYQRSSYLQKKGGQEHGIVCLEGQNRSQAVFLRSASITFNRFSESGMFYVSLLVAWALVRHQDYRNHTCLGDQWEAEKRIQNKGVRPRRTLSRICSSSKRDKRCKSTDDTW